MTAYQTLKREARRLDLPHAFKDDLLAHDKALLKKQCPKRFGWVLRTAGTNLYLPEWADSEWTKVELKGYKTGILDQARFYWYEAETLREVDADVLLDCLKLAQEHPETANVLAAIQERDERTRWGFDINIF